MRSKLLLDSHMGCYQPQKVENISTKTYEIVQNQGGGNCGIYSIMHAMWGTDNSDVVRVPIIRNQIALVMKGFLELYRYINSLRPQSSNTYTVRPFENDPKEIIMLYKNIFRDANSFQIFKFVSIEKLSSPLQDQGTKAETKNNLQRAIDNLKETNNWDDLQAKPDIVIQIFVTCNLFDIDMNAAIDDHNSPSKQILDPVTCTSEEYEQHIAKDGVWLNNSELTGYLLNCGYMQHRSITDSNLGGTLIEFRNNEGKIVRLHNNAQDRDATTLSHAVEMHWQAVNDISYQYEIESAILDRIAIKKKLEVSMRDIDLALRIQEWSKENELSISRHKYPDASTREFVSTNTHGDSAYTDNLKVILDFYHAGVECYANNDLRMAEDNFVKVIRPVLSKPSKKSLNIRLEDIKNEVLKAMYHIGLIYQRSIDYDNNYAKAAAIFQYCAAFAKKYHLHGTEFYLEEAYAIEHRLLAQNPDLKPTEDVLKALVGYYTQDKSEVTLTLVRDIYYFVGNEHFSVDVLMDININTRTQESLMLLEQDSLPSEILGSLENNINIVD